MCKSGTRKVKCETGFFICSGGAFAPYKQGIFTKIPLIQNEITKMPSSHTNCVELEINSYRSCSATTTPSIVAIMVSFERTLAILALNYRKFYCH